MPRNLWSPEKKRRVILVMRELEAESVPSRTASGRKMHSHAGPEIKELAQAYNISVHTLKNWARELGL